MDYKTMEKNDKPHNFFSFLILYNVRNALFHKKPGTKWQNNNNKKLGKKNLLSN